MLMPLAVYQYANAFSRVTVWMFACMYNKLLIKPGPGSGLLAVSLYYTAQKN